MPPRKSRSSSGRSKSRGADTKGKSQRKSGRGNDFTLHVSEMANGGYALGRHAGRTVLLPYAIPGEKVQARIVRNEQRVDFAQGVQLLDASADRVYPECPHFGPGRCWGCQWQHISYEAQCLLKYDVVADQLQRFGKFSDKLLQDALKPVIPAPEQWFYNRQMRFMRMQDGSLGLPKIDGRNLEPIVICHVLHPDLQSLRDSLDIDFPEMRALTLIDNDDGAPMIILDMAQEATPELSADLPMSVNIVLPDNEPVNLVGETSVRYRIGAQWLRVTAGAFFRANVAQVGPLVDTVLTLAELKPDDAVLDLYAGVGLFSMFAAPHVDLVTAVESYPPAATDAEVNLEALENVDIIEGAVEEALTTFVDEEAGYDVALVDPPGRGLSRDALQHLVKLGIRRVVYVSSSPATLGRDGAALAAAGYRLRRVQPIDFAPQTYYADMVALFEKSH